MTTPEISIIVPHLNQPDHLDALLTALSVQTVDPDRFETIVVDNGSRELPHAVVRRFPNVLLAEETIPGPGPARNRGVALSRTSLLAFTDADCRPTPDWIERILERFAAEAGLAILGGDIRVYPARPETPTMAEAYDMLYAFRQQYYITRQGFSVTANLAARRTVYNAVGPFGGIEIAEDNDWGYRAGRLGYSTVYAPEVIVHHPARRSLPELYAKWDRHISHHYAAKTKPLGKAKWVAKALALGISPLAELPQILRSNRIPNAKLRGRAFGGLVAVRLYRTRRMLAAVLHPGSGGAGSRWNR